ncbi:hypothetical protein CVT25_003259, partial [Psilocybe cyanescens]
FASLTEELLSQKLFWHWFIKIFNCLYHVSDAASLPISIQWHRKKRPSGQITCSKNSLPQCHDSSLHLEPFYCSSGYSSPQSSFGSLTSSGSTQSPPSSQSSLADLPAFSPLPFARPQPRIQVSSLLADPHTRTYDLEIVQHPLRTAEFGAAYLSRVPLTPPTIARLTVRDSSRNSVIPEAELPFLVAHLSLYSGDGVTALDMGSFIGRGVLQNPPTLYGHLVSTVEQLEDLQGNMGLFFLFPDVSIRLRGRYQIKVTLSRLSK